MKKKDTYIKTQAIFSDSKNFGCTDHRFTSNIIENIENIFTYLHKSRSPFSLKKIYYQKFYMVGKGHEISLSI